MANIDSFADRVGYN